MKDFPINEAEREIEAILTAQNPSVYESRKHKTNYGKVPRSMYYYHATVDRSGDLIVTNFYHDNGKEKIESNDLPKLIRKLALNARLPYGHVPPKHGDDFGDIWRRKSYFVILLDDNQYQFLPEAVVVYYGDTYNPNYAFFDAVNVPIDVSPLKDGSQMRTAVCILNHMKKDAQGTDIGKKPDGTPEAQKFRFLIYYGVDRFSPYTAEGTNLGPPASPPLVPV